MKALILAALVAGTPASDPETEALQQRCAAGGGCAIVTRAQFLEAVRDAYTRGAQEAIGELDSHGCQRGKT